mgnify:CR=1 FL=1
MSLQNFLFHSNEVGLIHRRSYNIMTKLDPVENFNARE